jgi:hypothetical protein
MLKDSFCSPRNGEQLRSPFHFYLFYIRSGVLA